jgi:hypothetical protein
VLELWVNAASHSNATAQASYLTFTHQLLQNARVSEINTSCTLTGTLTPDTATFDAVLQNEVCNGPGNCIFRGVETAPGSMGFASGTLDAGSGGMFRIAEIGLCAVATGQAVLHWQFDPPDPPSRNTQVIDAKGGTISNRALFVDYTINIVNATATPAPTLTPCAITFSDVNPTDYFYEPVRYLYCMGAVSGYADNTFRPFNETTRGQLSKIIVLAEGWPTINPTIPTFSDVPTNHPFYVFVETAANHGVISGYADGTFRPFNNVTRGQLSKIVVLAEGWQLVNPTAPTFTDVPTNHPFYTFIETAYDRGIVSGYADGTFRPANNATRGQIAKIVYLAITSR